ncbi:MAG: threonylcarbamoyl-AMP synthase [Spirochaetae bacterium HGW-Spirochaetae-5]|nr:MAG: threonylcarbamoyl-AMP synthase [Spirochaetae bacterium HGW-Spirochaetae-5]
MIFVINEENPQLRLINKTVEILKEGGVIVFPTDTVYAYGCDIKDKRAIERIYRLKKMEKHKPLSFIFTTISDINDYARNISDDAYKIMKKALPGPYTFIFKASKLVPKVVVTNQKTVGVRIPDNNIAIEIVKALGRPLLATSVSNHDGSYIVEPKDLEKIYRNEVDLVIDCGPKISSPSTVIDMTGETFRVIREGKGEIFFT